MKLYNGLLYTCSYFQLHFIPLLLGKHQWTLLAFPLLHLHGGAVKGIFLGSYYIGYLTSTLTGTPHSSSCSSRISQGTILISNMGSGEIC